MFFPRLPILLFIALFLCGPAAYAQKSVTVAWQNSASPGTRLRNQSGADLPAGTAVRGDGALLQLGFYSAGSTANPFAGTFRPLTGEAASFPGALTTSVGDDPGGAAGRFSLVTTFEEEGAGSSQNLPPAGTPLVVRFYNAATTAASTHFNEVSSTSSGWLWKSPALAPGELLIISLSDANLVWRGTPFQTSEPVGETGANFTLDVLSATVPAAGGTVVVNVTAANSAAAWSAISRVAWINSDSSAAKAGSRAVTLSVGANSGAARSGVVLVAGRVVIVNQEAGMSGGGPQILLDPDRAFVSSLVGTGSFRVIASDSTLSWSAVSDSDWLKISGSNSQIGSATVLYSVTALSGGTQRTGKITVAGLSFIVTQAAGNAAATVSVTVDGPGSVSGIPTTSKAVGSLITLTAKPSAGAVFNGWSIAGATLSPGKQLDPVLKWIVADTNAITASFVKNPFADSLLATTYAGVVRGEDPFAPDQNGYLTLTLSPTGAFSGRLRLGKIAYPIAGSFSGNGRAEISIPRTATSNYFVRFAVDGENVALVGSVSLDASIGVALAGFNIPGIATALSIPAEKNYTLRLKALGGEDFGAGFATLNLSKSGSVYWSGRLPDGSAISAFSKLDLQSGFGLHVPLYLRAGFVAGYFTFREIPFQSDVDGSFSWFKPPAGLADNNPLYRSGIKSLMGSEGSIYQKPRENESVLDRSQEEYFGVARLTGGSLGAEGEAGSVRVDARHKLQGSGGIASLQAQINPNNGVLSGTFIHEVTGKPVPIRGVVIQKTRRADGFFSGSNTTGVFSLEEP